MILLVIIFLIVLVSSGIEKPDNLDSILYYEDDVAKTAASKKINLSKSTQTEPQGDKDKKIDNPSEDFNNTSDELVQDARRLLDEITE